MDFSGKTIAVAITGSIAAYKACDFIRELYRRGAKQVLCIMSRSAQAFISPLTLQSLSQNPVYSDELSVEHQSGIPIHITIAQQADTLVIFPATANTLAKLANGLADDLISTTVITFTGKPVLIAPAMNTRMWDHPLTKQHIKTLKALPNYCVIAPTSGLLACGEEGDGHLADQNLILQTLYRSLHSNRMLYHGIRAMVTAGGTEEPIDAVRIITNRSSGKMGLALADALDSMGASVCLITTKALPTPRPYTVLMVKTAQEMADTMATHWDETQLLIMAAAVSDCRISAANKSRKLKTDTLLSQSISFEKNPDILETFSTEKRTHQYILGFAAESEQLLANAREKLERKKLDAIVANDISQSDIGFDTDENAASVILKNQKDVITLPKMSKYRLAENILEIIHPTLQHPY